MARLHTHPETFPVSGHYDPVSQAFHSQKIALIEGVVAERSWTGMKVYRDREDGRTDLTIEGDAEHVKNLLLTLHHHGAALFTVEAASEAELNTLEKEFDAVPAVRLELGDPD